MALLAAINSGLPGLAPKLFDAVEVAAATSLLDAVNALTGIPGDERERLTAWLDSEPKWAMLPLGRLATRLDVVRRLSFHRERALLT